MIISFNLEKIHVEKKKEFKGKAEARNNLKLTSIEEFKISTPQDEEKPLKISFSFKLNYEPDIASILL